MQDILGLNLAELTKVIAGWGKPAFHARQIFSWIYQKGARDFEVMSDLPSDLRGRLKEKFYFSSLRLVHALTSLDGTKKFLFALKDGSLIESVLIPQEVRVTGCVSTQAGCRFRCSFCASGASGFKRNLSCAEIIAEVLYLKDNAPGKNLTHLVFMGTGEPLDNYDNLLESIRLINSPDAFNIGARKVTVSTCGITPAIKKLARENLQIELSVSLHAADDRIRSRIMPVNKIYPLKGLISAGKEYVGKTGRQITFEYVLVKGVNSSLQDAQKLSTILRGFRLCKINLIPANAVAEYGIEPPQRSEILSFRDYLERRRINTTLRKPRGRDIEAACGQLRLRYGKE